MSEHNITVRSGSSVRLLTAGKYCDRDILVTAEGGNVDLPAIGITLNNCTWDQISAIAASGKAKDYFAVGDAKKITINGTVGNTVFESLNVWAHIIGFDHNSEIEGGRTIHFQIGKTAQVSGIDICLVDSEYNKNVASTGYFSMNTLDDNQGGWKYSYMREVLLGSTHTPTVPLSGSLLAALPSDLRSVMKGVTKYTDNVGYGENTPDCVTETEDYLWLPSEFEVFGNTTCSNAAEQTYQKQYAYYASGNAKKRYKHNGTSTAAGWRLRSPDTVSPTEFCFVNISGNCGTRTAECSFGLAPCFCV